MPFFISGYLAADGCISYNKLWDCPILQFSSCSYNFLNDLQKLLIKQTGIKDKNYVREAQRSKGSFPSNKKCYNMVFYKLKAIKCCDWIFDPTTELTRCNRKYNKYVEYKRRLLNNT